MDKVTKVLLKANLVPKQAELHFFLHKCYMFENVSFTLIDAERSEAIELSIANLSVINLHISDNFIDCLNCETDRYKTAVEYTTHITDSLTGLSMLNM